MALRYIALLILPFLSSLSAIAAQTSGSGAKPDSECRCFPGEACWPSRGEWAEFNRTLGGKLIATIPIGSPCHDDPFAPYSAVECARVQSNWGFPEAHYSTSSSVMASFFANISCDPFTPRSSQCVLGTYIQYAVDARSAADYQKTLAFTQRRNIRLVIRNTGHDYLGKSTGAGALGLWTHNMKSVQVIDYSSGAYHGKALKVAAGVQVFEAQAAAHARGLVVVGGQCPSVGLAGGYTQGGGHGPLASRFGLGADQVLEWEVVTAAGERVVAAPTGPHADLYWALSGGGGSAFAAVLGVTVKAHADMRVAGANLTFTAQGVTEDVFYGVVQTFLMTLPRIVDAGGVSVWLLAAGFFSIQPIFAPDVSVAELQRLLDPTLAALNRSGIPYDYFIGDFPTFLGNYNAMNPPANVTEFNIGGRIIPRSLVATNSSAAQLTEALRFIVNNGAVLSGVSVDVSRDASAIPNAVNPPWRSAIFSSVFGTPYDRFNFSANVAGKKKVTEVLMPKLVQLTPGGGSYLNEADSQQPNFQQAFYGSNYARLKSIKKTYDPSSIFYALTAVGSENWEVRRDGRLCKVG